MRRRNLSEKGRKIHRKIFGKGWLPPREAFQDTAGGKKLAGGREV